MRKTILIDDIDAARTKDVAAVEFAFQGITYEIDLSARSLKDLETALTPFLKAGRPIKGKKPAPRTKSKSKRGRTSDLVGVRQWAADNGFNIGARGRIPQEVTDAYNARTTA